MRISSRSLLPLLAAFVLMGASAFGQSVFTCSSDDMGQHACRVGPNQGIRFLRQRSQSACIEGQSYGIARDGVWVTNGCRADFQVLQNGNYNDGQYNRQGTWNDRREHDYDDDRQYPQARRHHHDDDDNVNGQYNGAYNRGGYVSSGQPIQYLGRYDDGKSTCSSQPGTGPIFCQSGGPFRDAYIVKQNGQNECVRGQNWDVGPNHGLWIADGCSGQWKIQK